LTAEHLHDQEIRSALARCIGAGVLKSVRPTFARRPKRRVINVFPFSDELTLLRIRLEEMADWVDQFVLIEATETFAGAPKPLHFLEHAHEFDAFKSKIIHLPVRGFPAHANTHWARDFYQRDQGIAALKGLCGEDDLIFITDVDEIVDRRAVEGFDGDFARLHMGVFRFFLNYRPISRFQGRTGAVWKAGRLRDYGMSYARFVLSRQSKDWCRILDAGWHFTSVGDAAQVAFKFQNYAHQEHVNANREEAGLRERLEGIRAGQMQRGWERCEIDDSFPAYVRQHQDELASIIL
jgi:beta-1,4-mannosyl-glycoprotein beta-1,4-N-acetylglucosaminyltransferase